MTKYRLEIRQSPPDHDSNEFWIYEGESKEWIGHGYQSKETKKLHLERCPRCRRENYSIQVAVGPCYNCGFDPNVKELYE